MKLKSIYLASLLMAALPATAFAQATIPPNVDFTASASMPSLKDPSRKDVFAVNIGDAQVKTQLELTCSAGYTQFLVVRSDKACAVAGSGSIVNPANQAVLPRTQYSVAIPSTRMATLTAAAWRSIIWRSARWPPRLVLFPAR